MGDAIEPPSVSPCGECGMPVEPTAYHPYLHCIIWSALHLDPADVLTEHGYSRKSADGN